MKTTENAKNAKEELLGRLGRIDSYLGNGGFFNPEAMEHDKVRDLLIDCGDFIRRTGEAAGSESLREAVRQAETNQRELLGVRNALQKENENLRGVIQRYEDAWAESNL